MHMGAPHTHHTTLQLVGAELTSVAGAAAVVAAGVTGTASAPPPDREMSFTAPVDRVEQPQGYHVCAAWESVSGTSSDVPLLVKVTFLAGKSRVMVTVSPVFRVPLRCWPDVITPRSWSHTMASVVPPHRRSYTRMSIGAVAVQMPIWVEVPPHDVSCSCHVCTPPNMGKLPRAPALPEGDPVFWKVAVRPSEDTSVQVLELVESQTHWG